MKDGRERILEEAYALLRELKDPSKVTVREIAKRACVGVGLINYHFKTKDSMLMEALSLALKGVAERWRDNEALANQDPKNGLRRMLVELMEMGAEQLYFIQLAAKYELTDGVINTPLYLLPYVMQLSGLDERRSKLLAFSMICAIQSASLRQDAFRQYLGYDLERSEDRALFIDHLIDSHLVKG